MSSPVKLHSLMTEPTALAPPLDTTLSLTVTISDTGPSCASWVAFDRGANADDCKDMLLWSAC